MRGDKRVMCVCSRKIESQKTLKDALAVVKQRERTGDKGEGKRGKREIIIIFNEWHGWTYHKLESSLKRVAQPKVLSRGGTHGSGRWGQFNLSHIDHTTTGAAVIKDEKRWPASQLDYPAGFKLLLRVQCWSASTTSVSNLCNRRS